MIGRILALGLLSLVLAVAACGSAGHHAAATVTRTVTATPSPSSTYPPGCGQVLAVVSTAQGEVTANTPASLRQASRQLSAASHIINIVPLSGASADQVTMDSVAVYLLTASQEIDIYRAAEKYSDPNTAKYGGEADTDLTKLLSDCGQS